MAMPSDSGRDVALLRNPATGAFDSFDWDSTGNPTFDDSDSHTVLSLLVETLGGYWADLTGKRGSILYQIRLDVTSTATQLVAAATNALSWAISNRQIRGATATAARVRPGRYDLGVKYQNRDGHEQNKRLPIGA